jgi:hypothetical protein
MDVILKHIKQASLLQHVGKNGFIAKAPSYKLNAPFAAVEPS